MLYVLQSPGRTSDVQLYLEANAANREVDDMPAIAAHLNQKPGISAGSSYTIVSKKSKK